MQHQGPIPVSPSSPARPAAAGCPLGAALAAACLLLLAVPAAQAQIFPDNPGLVWSDDFDYTTGQTACWGSNGRGWEQWVDDAWYDEPGDPCSGYSGWDNWLFADDYGFPDNLDNGAWGTGFLTTYVYCQRESSMLVPQKSLPGHPDYDPDDWTNVSLQFDFMPRQFSAVGILWGMTGIDQTLNPEQIREPADGYAFYLDPYEPPPNDGYPGWPASAGDPNRMVRWRIARIEGKDRLQSDISGVRKWQTLADGVVNPDNAATENAGWMIQGNRVYTLRLDWYCGNFRVRYMSKWGPYPAEPHPGGTTFYGCSSAADADGICCDQAGDVYPGCMEDCWCTITEGPMAGIDPNPVIEGPGAVGIYNSGAYTFCSTNTFRQGFDNFEARSFAAECGLVCGAWNGWAPARTDVIPFKFLYEGGLLDFSAGRNITPAPDMAKIDIATEAPVFDATYNHSLDANPYCNGWNLLEDLPAPAEDTNLDAIMALLEPMHSAIDFEPNGGGGFDWVPQFDNDPYLADGVTPNPDYNPVPMVADGSTPIAGSLAQAFDWYVEQRTTGDWADDPYEGCRQWYVILITDGEEACEFEGGVPNPDAVCEPGGAASKFADPGIAGVDPLPVYTIGFSETVAADSPLGCIAEQTGGTFLTAENASQLSAALYDVFYRIEGAKRSFSPFKIAPPPAGSTGNPTRDYLAVYPLFQPQQGQTLWSGNLWAYPLNEEQRDLPTLPGNDCEVDTSQLAWTAYDALAAQLAAHTPGNPHRFVYMGSDHGGSWSRYDLATIPTDSALRTEFKLLLDASGGVNDVVAQQVVNFVRNIYMDSDDDPSNAGPPGDPRPEGYPVLGDFFHSQPVIVNPPNTPMYFYDYGFSVAGEAGAHNYGTFMQQQAKRRRVVLAGANDGMLHAFDGGVWNRDRENEDNLETDPYDQIHDLGTGTELFAWVPQAVMGNLYDMTSGGSIEHSEHQYMVDGPITKGDAFIDHDGDGTREWRTVALSSMRRGGRGVLALDITQPDPIGSAPSYQPEVSTFAGCRDGSMTGCNGEYPMLLWEFSDTADEDGNCPTTGDACAPYWDLGWTWSEPAIARIAVYNSSNVQEPGDTFVAFFGGGWDPTNTDATGTFFYGVDLATGAVVLKENMDVDLPGGVTALDSDVDGFHDRIYFADSDGGVHRLQFPSPVSASATGAAAGTMTRIFDFRAANGGFADRQEFFTRPIPVPVLFDGTDYTWALAIGSGDRADLARTDSGIDHVYFLIDAGDGATRGIGDLESIDYTELDGSFDCQGTNALVPPNYGWYLSLRDTEKVVNDVLVLNGIVFVPTFDPTTQEATNPPNVCGGAPDEDGGTVEVSNVCRASGIGRGYQLWYECGQGKYDEFNEFITGTVPDGSGGKTEQKWTDDDPEKPDHGEEVANVRRYRVTNWRQE